MFILIRVECRLAPIGCPRACQTETAIEGGCERDRTCRCSGALRPYGRPQQAAQSGSIQRCVRGGVCDLTLRNVAAVVRDRPKLSRRRQLDRWPPGAFDKSPFTSVLVNCQVVIKQEQQRHVERLLPISHSNRRDSRYAVTCGVVKTPFGYFEQLRRSHSNCAVAAQTDAATLESAHRD